MARKKIREYDAKRLLKAHASRLAGAELRLNCVQVRGDTDFADLLDRHPWLKSTPLVVKPDMLFGQRGKHGLVGLNLGFIDAEAFVRRKMGAVVEIGGVASPVDTFLIEPFVPHDEEMYFGIQSVRDGWEMRFSEAGGVEVEENWDRVKTMALATADDPVSDDAFAPLISTLPLEVQGKVGAFIGACFAVFEDLDFTLMEFNPLTLVDGEVLPLDMRAEVDDTAQFRNGKKWGELEFPLPFGRRMTGAEAFVHGLDEQTGASLKLSILNPKGHIWTMVAGGGASVIYADTVGDLGMASELGNYAEYSGAPNAKETYLFARTLVDAATTDPDGQPRALIVGGGIANFTDVAATFKGIIQAFRERADALKMCQMRIYVRRGGPNYRAGLDAMRALGEELQLPISVHGPEASMTGICQSAIDYVSG